MRIGIRVIGVAIGAGFAVADAVVGVVRCARRWPWPAEPIRTDEGVAGAHELAGLSNDSIDFLLSRDSMRRS